MKNPPPQACPKTRILLVDDHPLTRDGIALLISRESDLLVSAQAGNAAQALAAVLADQPDLVVVDLNLPDKSGIELIKDLKAVAPKLRVLVLSMHDEAIYAERALRAGAAGYIMKVEGGRKLVEAIRRVLAGEIYVSAAISSRILRGFRGQPAAGPRALVEKLSDRELEVFRLFGTGISTSEIGDRLHLSPKTIEAHRSNIKTKLDIATAAELISYAAHWIAAEDAPK